MHNAADGRLVSRYPAPPVPVPRRPLPVLPPDSPWSNRIDRAIDAASPAGWSGATVDRWLPAFQGPSRTQAAVHGAVGALGGGGRVDDPHLRNSAWFENVACGVGALAVVRGLLGDDVAIDASRLLGHRPGTRAGVPVHQDVPEVGAVDPRFAVTALYLIAHATRGAVPVSDPRLRTFAHVAPHTQGEGYMRHEDVDCGEFGTLPGLVREDGRRWWTVLVPLVPGDMLCLDTRTLRAYGTDRRWIALTVRWVAPAAIIHRPDGARPPMRACGGFTGWHSRAELQKARRVAVRESEPAGRGMLS